jgi:hypothetical protein
MRAGVLGMHLRGENVRGSKKFTQDTNCMGKGITYTLWKKVAMTDDAGREKQPTQKTCPKANGEKMIEDEDCRGSIIALGVVVAPINAHHLIWPCGAAGAKLLWVRNGL